MQKKICQCESNLLNLQPTSPLLSQLQINHLINMRFHTAVIWNGISQFGISGITLLSTILLARLLTPDDFAIIGIVTIFIAFSQMMVDSEMGGALLRKKDVSRTDYSTLFYYNLIISFILYVSLFFTAPLIADFYKQSELVSVVRILSLTIIIHAFRVVQNIILLRALKFRDLALINVSSGLISLGVALWLAEKGYGYWALIWQQLIIAILNVLIMSCINRFIPLLTFSKESFKYQFAFGINLLGANTIRTIANNISANIIAKISTLQLTGYYTQSTRITNFCQNSIGSIMDQSVFPMLAKCEQITDIAKAYHKLLRMLCIVLIVISAALVLFAHTIISIILGEQWLEATWMFRILSLAILPTTLQVLCRNIIKALGSTSKVFYLETTKSIIVITSLVIAAFCGTTAVVWAVVISQTLSCIIWLVRTHKILKDATNLHTNSINNAPPLS